MTVGLLRLDLDGDHARKWEDNGITDHGGPVMLGTTVNVYYIWYGNWAGNTATTILTDLAQNLGGSPYYNINTTYTDAAGTHVSNSLHDSRLDDRQLLAGHGARRRGIPTWSRPPSPAG